MKKYLLVFLGILFSPSIAAQESIVNYLDRSGEIVSKYDAEYIEVIKKEDSLWSVKKFFRKGNLKEQGHFKTKDKELPVGKFVHYYRNDSISATWSYDDAGKKNGKYLGWFDDGSVNLTGTYINDLKEGIWKYYHLNGKVACQRYYKNDTLLKTILFNEKGQRIDVELIEERAPSFTGGDKKLKNKLEQIERYLHHEIDGDLRLTLFINADGTVKRVMIDEDVPRSLENLIMHHYKKIKGWTSAIQMNRRIPFTYRVKLKFRPK